MERTFEIIDTDQAVGGQALKCLKCGMVSYNPNDVKQRYCGKCHEFLDGPFLRGNHFMGCNTAVTVVCENPEHDAVEGCPGPGCWRHRGKETTR